MKMKFKPTADLLTFGKENSSTVEVVEIDNEPVVGTFMNFINNKIEDCIDYHNKQKHEVPEVSIPELRGWTDEDVKKLIYKVNPIMLNTRKQTVDEVFIEFKKEKGIK